MELAELHTELERLSAASSDVMACYFEINRRIAELKIKIADASSESAERLRESSRERSGPSPIGTIKGSAKNK